MTEYPSWACKTLRIRMRQTVCAGFPFNMLKPGTILAAGHEYEAVANRYGAVSGLCDNGELLGVKPEEFECVDGTLGPWVIAGPEGAGEREFLCMDQAGHFVIKPLSAISGTGYEAAMFDGPKEAEAWKNRYDTTNQFAIMLADAVFKRKESIA